MLNRDSFFVVHGADPKRWCARYGLEPFTIPCNARCGRDVTTSIPFVRGELRGLIAPVCECGCIDTPYCAVGARDDILTVLALAPRRRRTKKRAKVIPMRFESTRAPRR
jgi:hypothetical protein